MNDNLITTEDQTDNRKFPVLHLFAGLIISFFAFIFIIQVYFYICSIFFPIYTNYGSGIPAVLRAYFIPESIIIGALIFLATKTYRSGSTGFSRSYITMIVVNIICFCMVCAVMGTVQC